MTLNEEAQSTSTFSDEPHDHELSAETKSYTVYS
jgi:hypothetical protein